MNKLLLITIIVGCTMRAQSQVDSLFLKSYDDKVIENNELRNEVQMIRKALLDKTASLKKDSLDFKKQLEGLQAELEKEKQKVLDLNKTKMRAERDLLLQKMDSLNNLILNLENRLKVKNTEIVDLKASTEKRAIEEKHKGKDEVVAIIIDAYQNQQFDDLIRSTNDSIIARDRQFADNHPDVIEILNDLQIIFIAQELLDQKFDAIRVKNAQLQLSQINRQSDLLDELKKDLKYYEDFNKALRETIVDLIDLDKEKSNSVDSEIQKLKFKDVIGIMSDFIYNYYDFNKYGYLSDIVIDIVKRKRIDADASVNDLLIKLE